MSKKYGSTLTENYFFHFCLKNTYKSKSSKFCKISRFFDVFFSQIKSEMTDFGPKEARTTLKAHWINFIEFFNFFHLSASCKLSIMNELLGLGTEVPICIKTCLEQNKIRPSRAVTACSGSIH
jgi:hypothetical protein